LNWVTYREGVAIPKASNLEHVEKNASSSVIRVAAEDYRALSRTSR